MATHESHEQFNIRKTYKYYNGLSKFSWWVGSLYET